MVWECNGEDMDRYVMKVLCLKWFENEWKFGWDEMGRFYNGLWLVLVIGKSESDDEMNWVGWECNGEDMEGDVMILLCFEWFEKEWNDLLSWNG